MNMIEDTSHGHVNTSTDNIVNDTQQVSEMSNQQQSKSNYLANLKDDDALVNTDQLPSHVIIETVQFEDYTKQKNGEKVVVEDGDDGEMIEVVELDDEEEEEEDDDDNFQLSPVKRSRQSRKQKQAITVTLQCPLVACGLVFAKDKLSKHMKERHSIDSYRCAVKNCCLRFTNKRTLGLHISQFHQHITQWHCEKCVKHFISHSQLSTHNKEHHQLGLFQCSFSACAFTGENRMQVYNHYTQQHKSIKCDHADCQYETSSLLRMKHHQGTHLGIRPYRCKWPRCKFASIQRAATIGHIRTMHLKRSTIPNGAQLADPKDYLEEVSELLI